MPFNAGGGRISFSYLLSQRYVGDVALLRLLRDGVILWTGKLASLRRFKDDVREVEKGYECGMNLEGFNDIKVGDMLETFVQEEVSPV